MPFDFPTDLSLHCYAYYSPARPYETPDPPGMGDRPEGGSHDHDDEDDSICGKIELRPSFTAGTIKHNGNSRGLMYCA